jgi:hypothetical protein
MVQWWPAHLSFSFGPADPLPLGEGGAVPAEKLLFFELILLQING